MKYVMTDPDKIDEALIVAQAPFVRNHDEARMLLMVAQDHNNTHAVRALCGTLGIMVVTHGWERAIGYLSAVWYYNGHDQREAIETACYIMSIEDFDELRTNI
jgi:hypothetical protein